MNEIEIPNFTQIPNVVFDYWMPKLSPSDFKVLLLFCRKTFGWHQLEDCLSISQIQKLTGLGSTSVKKSIKNLIECGLIKRFSQKDEYGGKSSNKYHISIKNYHGRETSKGRSQNVQGDGRETSIQNKGSKINKESTLKSTKESVSAFLAFGSFVKIKKEDLSNLELAHGKEKIHEYIESINDYLLSSGKKPYQDYAATIRQWIKRDEKKNQNTQPSSKLSEQAQINIALYDDAQSQSKRVQTEYKKWGNKYITAIDNSWDLHFDINPGDFKSAFFKHAGLKESD